MSLLREVRMSHFDRQSGTPDSCTAAQLLSLTVRHVTRLKQAVIAGGASALILTAPYLKSFVVRDTLVAGSRYLRGASPSPGLRDFLGDVPCDASLQS